MLRLAVEAQLPIIAVTTRDVMNLHEVLETLTGKKPVSWQPQMPLVENALYTFIGPPKAELPLMELYSKFVKAESTLVVVNPAQVKEPMYNAGEVPVPRELVHRLMCHVVDNKKKATELLRGLGGCTVKEAAELARLTMARDASLTVDGLMETRRSGFMGAHGLTPVDAKQSFYDPPEALLKWVQRESYFFLEGTDPRLIPRGLLFDGPPGCVAEGTLIRVKRGKRNGGRLLPIEALYEKFNGVGKPVSPWRKELPSFTQSWHAESGRVVYNLIEGVYDKGVKPCLQVTTDSAGAVVLTYDHPVLRADGVFVRADQLKVGDKVLARASMLPEGEGRQVRRPRVVIEGLKHYAGGWFKDVWDKSSDTIYTYKRQHRARLVVEAHLNGVPYEEFVETLKTDPAASSKFKLLPDDADVHHIDEDPQNDTLTNLEVINRKDHYLLHNPEPWTRFKVDYTREAVVTSITDAGSRRTFDLSMGSPCANFTVNAGIIVHNTGKTSGAKWLSEQMGVPLYRMDIGGTKSKWVGESEAQLLTNLSRLDNEAPAIALFDEIEKIFATGGSPESGTTSSMLSQLLWWLAERRSRIFVVMTTNNAKSLPKELYREGRVDEVIWMTGLDQSAAVNFVHSLLKTFKGLKVSNETDLVFQILKRTPTITGTKPELWAHAALTKGVYTAVKNITLSTAKGKAA